MSQIVAWIENFAHKSGGLGLLIVSLLDSSVLPLPELNDVLMVFTVASHEARMVFYAAMATLGSLIGCFILYFIGAKGGDALIKKRFGGKYLDRAMRAFERYGMMAIVVPAILPPPAPFKLFVLMAGTVRMPKSKFALALVLGRGVRFFAIGLLAVWYGDSTITFIRDHGTVISAVVGLAVLAVGIFVMRHKLHRRQRS